MLRPPIFNVERKPVSCFKVAARVAAISTVNSMYEPDTNNASIISTMELAAPTRVQPSTARSASNTLFVG